jgi:hypothetical protein
MSVVDIPPGIGLQGTPLAVFKPPARSRRLATASLVIVVGFGALTWLSVSRHPYRYYASTQVILPIAFAAISLLGFAVRRAQLAITRDGVRWGWDAWSFTQQASRIITAHAYADGVALEARRGSTTGWFLAARDWDRYDAIVRQMRRAELPVQEHAGKAPLRARLQSYGRFLDALLVGAIAGAFSVMLWSA